MSGFSQSSVSSQNSRGTKRKWVPEEDVVLVACMVDLHNVGTFNADTGFKVGYLNELERMLENFLPHVMLKAKPNLESRIRTLKGDWAIVYDMLSEKDNSSFAWDEHRQLVVAEDVVWDSYINSHKEAGQFRHRSCPYYDQLTAIYIIDRATRKYVQTTADIIEEIDVEDVATANTHTERNNIHGCKVDVCNTPYPHS
ncbi:L10-interacting MYB domain-containing protein-like [Gossypium raimondii]|uniref:L10-interacting MYB domain-containing protein-like n=1 Tax=Gossypium raimondii TaxID=29730 RepID=UPI00063ABDDD|nr:L10-interacting MYB domain-containing protein-like [Gossypium raimondii]